MVDKAPAVTEEQFVRYVETFLDEYRVAVEALLDPEVRGQLIRYSYLPAQVIAYVSSSVGVAINYITRGEEVRVEGWSGSKRADDFLLSVPEELRGNASTGVALKSTVATFHHVGFRNIIPISLDDEDAGAILIDVRSEIGHVSAHIDYAELYGTTRASRWTKEQARLRALQEVKVALADVWRAQQFSLSLMEVIRRRKEKAVLVLGSFKQSGRERINRIRQHLVDQGYLPVLVDEYPDIEDQNLAQKVATIGLASRFVIVEDSEAAGQLYELGAVCKANDLLTVIVREEGQQASFMTRGVSTTSRIINEYDYDAPTLNDTLDEAIDWAESKLPELEQAYRSTYPWRDPSNEPND